MILKTKHKAPLMRRLVVTQADYKWKDLTAVPEG